MSQASCTAHAVVLDEATMGLVLALLPLRSVANCALACKALYAIAKFRLVCAEVEARCEPLQAAHPWALRSLAISHYSRRPSCRAESIAWLLQRAVNLQAVTCSAWLLSEDHVQTITTSCSGLRRLTALRLTDAPMATTGTQTLASLLRDITQLHELDLSRNSIGTWGLQQLQPVLHTLPNLHTLRLTHNRLDDRAVPHLLAIYSTCTALRCLAVDGNHFTLAATPDYPLLDCYRLTEIRVSPGMECPIDALYNFPHLHALHLTRMPVWRCATPSNQDYSFRLPTFTSSLTQLALRAPTLEDAFDDPHDEARASIALNAMCALLTACTALLDLEVSIAEPGWSVVEGAALMSSTLELPQLTSLVLAGLSNSRLGWPMAPFSQAAHMMPLTLTRLTRAIVEMPSEAVCNTLGNMVALTSLGLRITWSQGEDAAAAGATALMSEALAKLTALVEAGIDVQPIVDGAAGCICGVTRTTSLRRLAVRRGRMPLQGTLLTAGAPAGDGWGLGGMAHLQDLQLDLSMSWCAWDRVLAGLGRLVGLTALRLGGSLCADTCAQLSRAVARLSRLERLVLKNNCWFQRVQWTRGAPHPSGLLGLGSALSHLGRLTHLCLETCCRHYHGCTDTDGAAAAAVAASFASLQRLKVLRLKCRDSHLWLGGLLHLRGLAALELRCESLRPVDCRLLQAALAGMRGLGSLLLMPGRSSVYLPAMPALQELTRLNCSEMHVHEKTVDAVVQWLAVELPRLVRLRVLQLPVSYFDTADVALPLADRVKHLCLASSLVQLDAKPGVAGPGPRWVQAREQLGDSLPEWFQWTDVEEHIERGGVPYLAQDVWQRLHLAPTF